MKRPSGKMPGSAMPDFGAQKSAGFPALRHREKSGTKVALARSRASFLRTANSKRKTIDDLHGLEDRNFLFANEKTRFSSENRDFKLAGWTGLEPAVPAHSSTTPVARTRASYKLRPAYENERRWEITGPF
jgi:hypothetical protein